MKINIDNIIIKCLYLIFIVTSYASYMPSSIIDDILVIFIGILLILKIFKKGFSNYGLLIVFIVVLLECFWVIISAKEYSSNAIWSFVSFIKIYILLMLTFYLNLENEHKNKILKNFAILSIPNLLLGFWQYYQVQIKGIDLVGKYELIGGTYFYRIQGGTGHPLYYALIMIELILYFLYNSKFKFKNIMVILCTILCALTYSSFSLTISIVLIVFKILAKKNMIIEVLQKHSRICIVLAIIFSSIFIYKYMFAETNTIRYVSTINTLSSINFSSFWTGIGFGSYLSSNYSEAYIFRIIYENGIIGLVSLILILFDLILMQIDNKNFSGMFICFVYILNLFINEGYIVPYIILIPIFCSQTINKNSNIYKQKSSE